jgi:hypothetical protein
VNSRSGCKPLRYRALRIRALRIEVWEMDDDSERKEKP